MSALLGAAMVPVRSLRKMQRLGCWKDGDRSALKNALRFHTFPHPRLLRESPTSVMLEPQPRECLITIGLKRGAGRTGPMVRFNIAVGSTFLPHLNACSPFKYAGRNSQLPKLLKSMTNEPVAQLDRASAF